MRRSARRRPAAPAAEDSFWISFSDLMSALLVVFLLAVVVLVLQLTDKQQALTEQEDKVAEQEALVASQREEFNAQIGTLREAEQVRGQMLEEIRSQLSDKGIEVTITSNNSVLSIPTEQLGFDRGSYEIRAEHQDVALEIGRTVSGVIAKDDRYRYLDTVFVEGHTDSEAFGGLEGTGNWGLSTFRAISLWRLWEDALPGSSKLDAMLRDDGTPLFSVSGYGDTRPATQAQKSEAERASNRRIDLRFTVVRPSSDDLAKIIDDAEPPVDS